MSTNTSDTNKGNIQIIDDKPENLNVLSSMLQKQGYDTRMAINGEIGLKSIRSDPPDLILLDIIMPGQSGYAVCKQLKADALTRDIPIIFISALHDTADKLKAFSTGGSDYISKPFEEEEVLARVETHLNLRKMQKRLEAQNVLLRQEITERKQAEDERFHFQKRLQKAQKAESLGRMAGSVAHHYNNLNFVISGNLELMRDKLTPQHQAIKHLDAAENAIRRSSELGRKMLIYLGHDFGKSSQHDFSNEAASVIPLIKEAMPDNIRLRMKLLSRLPVVRIGSDDVRRILTNIVENAWEALDGNAGTIEISTGKTSCDRDFLESAAWSENDTPGEYVYIEVNDQGCGMDADTTEQMFDPFFSTKFTGRGLGLAAVAGIVRANQGVVTVSSEPGTGTTVRVMFPAAGEPAVSAKPAPDTDATDIPVRGAVLLAEDTEGVRVICQIMLEQLGFKVLTAADGAEAVEIFRKKHKEIAFVLSDLSMPRMDGWETLRAIRNIRPDMVVIFASGYDEISAMRGHYTVLPQAFLQKPYKMANLKAILRKVLV